MRASIVANPIAGRRAAEGGIGPAVAVMERAGWQVDVHFSKQVGDATILARQAIERGQDTVIAAGGDGTLNEAAQAVAGTDVALGYLPYGTVNVWARELGIPMDGESAAHSIVTGRVELVDLGVVNERYFLLMTGIGFDGEVVRRAATLEKHKGRFGILPYAAAVLLTVPRYRGADVELRYDGLIRRHQALMVIVGNTRLYGGHFHFTPGAIANDGKLDVCVVKGRGFLTLARQSFPLLLTRSIGRADVEMYRVRELTIQTTGPVPFQVDGELAGETPARFTVAPRVLKVIVPRDFSSELLKGS